LDKSNDKTIQFITPYVLNAVSPHRMLIGTSSVYESLDQGDNLKKVGINLGPVQAMAYGGKDHGAVTDQSTAVVYVSTGAFGVSGFHPAKLWLRDTVDGPFRKLQAFPGGLVKDIAMDPDDWRTAWVVDDTDVYKTTDAGATWLRVTSFLPIGGLTSVEVVKVPRDPNNPNGPSDVVVLVGGLGRVYRATNPDQFAVWTEFGAGLPNAQVSDMRYDEGSDTLVVGTLGRGAWTMDEVKKAATLPGHLEIDGDATSDTIRLVLDAKNPSLLDVFINSNNNPTPTKQVQLSVLSSIEVFGLGGDNDKLIVDSTNGAITLPGPTGSIKFDGGTGINDRLVLVGGGGINNLNGPTNGEGSVLLFKNKSPERVTFSNVEAVDPSNLN